MTPDITIIGGGIIGLCSAIALQDVGQSVEIIDPQIPKQAASFGNCALLAVGENVPISKPGVIAKIPKWLLDPMGPLFVRPSALVTQAPWLARFLWAGRAKRVREIAATMPPLTHRAEADYRALLERVGAPEQLIAAENIFAFNHHSEYENDQYTWGLRRQYGFEHEFLSTEDLRAMEPALGGPIRCGVLAKGWLQFANPGEMLALLAAHFARNGGKLRRGAVQRFVTEGRAARSVILADGSEIAVRHAVLAAGAWSGVLARSLGLRLPIAALQGYHYQVATPKVQLNRAVLYASGGFVLTPLSSGLRIGGTIEIAGQNPKPNFARADILAQKALKVLPGLDISNPSRWMGPRPFMPDTLPVIGPAPRHDNVTLAFGHGQVGLTLGATTGQLVADLVAKRPSSIDLTPYSATRF